MDLQTFDTCPEALAFGDFAKAHGHRVKTLQLVDCWLVLVYARS